MSVAQRGGGLGGFSGLPFRGRRVEPPFMICLYKSPPEAGSTGDSRGRVEKQPHSWTPASQLWVLESEM